MYRPSKPVTARVYAIVNAAVVLSVLLGVFTALNWGRMPGGFGQFLAIRVTLKNLLLAALLLLSCAIAFRAFGLSRPSPAAPLWRELLQVTKACTVVSVLALFFPLTTQSGAFTFRLARSAVGSNIPWNVSQASAFETTTRPLYTCLSAVVTP
jgi:hypothetical protein